MLGVTSFIKTVVLGDVKNEEELVKQLGLRSDRISKIKLFIDGIDINVIFVFPDPRINNEQFLELYLVEADIIILCLSQKLFHDMLNGKFVRIWKYKNKHYVILVSADVDQLKVFDKFLDLGLRKIIIKDLSKIRSMNDLEEVIREIIKKSMRELIKSRKKRVLFSILEFLDNEAISREDVSEPLRKILKDLL